MIVDVHTYLFYVGLTFQAVDTAVFDLPKLDHTEVIDQAAIGFLLMQHDRMELMPMLEETRRDEMGFGGFFEKRQVLNSWVFRTHSVSGGGFFFLEHSIW